MEKSFAAQSLAVGAAFLAVIATSAAWIVNLRLGPRFEGFTGGAMVVALPLALFSVTALWLILRPAIARRWTLGTARVAVMAALLAFLAATFSCGPVACFQAGSNRMIGWFLVGGTVLAALIHHLVLKHHLRRS